MSHSADSDPLCMDHQLCRELAALGQSHVVAHLFENQGEPSQRQSMHANTVKVVARWYFGRDARVPFGRQILLSGPASTDQTSTAKLK